MGDAYKDALEQKKLDKLRRQAEDARRKRAASRQYAVSARPETPAERQRKIAKTSEEIVACEAKLKELKATSDSNFYMFFAILALVIFAMLLLTALVIFSKGDSQGDGLLMAFLAMLALGLSLLAQMAGMKTDKQKKEYTEKLKRLNNRLQLLKINWPPPQ